MTGDHGSKCISYPCPPCTVPYDVLYCTRAARNRAGAAQRAQDDHERHRSCGPAPLHRPHLRTPANCNNTELQALSFPPSPSAKPSPTSITASPAAAEPATLVRLYADSANTHARVLDNWCKFWFLIMGILPYCTCHCVYVQIALTEVHSRS